MESIIDGIRKAQHEAEVRCIRANAVLINDTMFATKLNIYPHIGEPRMICGLRAFYCPDLPPEVLFAVCETPQSEDKVKIVDVERVIKKYFIDCIEQGMTEVEVTESCAELCRAVAAIPYFGGDGG